MTLTNLKALGAVAVIALGAAGLGATTVMAKQQGADSDMAEAQAFLAAPGSITEAIAAVEKNTGGKAMSAEFETDDATSVVGYEVEVALKDGTVSTMMFNPADGSVTVILAEAEDDDGTDDDDEDGENKSN